METIAITFFNFTNHYPDFPMAIIDVLPIYYAIITCDFINDGTDCNQLFFSIHLLLWQLFL